jgi:hypothetical protein
MKKIFLIFVLISAQLALAQNTLEERMQRYNQFHQKLREQMLKGFDDKSLDEMNRMVDEMMDQSMRDFPSMGLSRFSSGLNLSWNERKDGRELIIIPKSKEDKLDVQVHNQLITIKMTKTDRNSHSESSHAQNVPADCDSDKVKMEAREGGLVMFFPWKKGQAPKSFNPDSERKLLKPQKKNIDV